MLPTLFPFQNCQLLSEKDYHKNLIKSNSKETFTNSIKERGDIMEKLIFKPKYEVGKGDDNRVRVKPDALAILRHLASSTGYSISYIASEMIKFAFKYTIIESFGFDDE